MGMESIFAMYGVLGLANAQLFARTMFTVVSSGFTVDTPRLLEKSLCPV
jgi:hypothetical protein